MAAWQRAFWPRYAIAAAVTVLVYIFPTADPEKGESVGTGYMMAVVVTTLMASFAR